MYNNYKQYSKQWDVDRSWENNPTMEAYYDMANVYGINDQPQMSQYDAVFFGRPGKSTEAANDLKYGYQHGKEAGKLGWSYSQYRDLPTANISDIFENKLTSLYSNKLGFPEKEPYPNLYNQEYIDPDDYFLSNGVFDYKRYNDDTLSNLRQAQSLYSGSTTLSSMTSSLSDLYSSDATFGEKLGGTVGTLFDTKAGRAIGGNAETGERGTVERILGIAGIPHAIVVGGIGGLTDGDDDTGFLSGAWKSFKNIQPLNKYRDEEATRGFSDLLDQWGWESTGKTDLFSMDTWNVNDIARTLVSFGGDILLDPMTYFSVGVDDFVFGSGETSKLKATTVDEATEYLTSIEKLATKEAIYDVMGELDNIKGIRKGKGITFGFDRVPVVGKKLDSMVGGRKELLTPEVTMAMGDKLFAPHINSLLDDMKSTGLFTSISTKNDALRRILTDESLVGKEVALAQANSRELFDSLQNISMDSKYADEFLSKLKPEEQADIINVLFNPNYIDDALEESLSEMYEKGFKDIRNTFFDGKAEDPDTMMKILDGVDISYGPSTGVLSYEDKQRKYFEKVLSDTIEDNFANVRKFNEYKFENYDEFIEGMRSINNRTILFDDDYVSKYLKGVEFQDFYNELTEYTQYMNGNSTVLSPDIRGVVKDVWSENQKYLQEMYETNGMGAKTYKAFELASRRVEDKRNIAFITDMMPETLGTFNSIYDSAGEYEAHKFVDWVNRYNNSPTPNIGNLESGESIKYMTRANLASGPDGWFSNKFVDDFNRSQELMERFDLGGYDLSRYDKLVSKETITDGSKFVVNGTELSSSDFSHMIEKERITNVGEYVKPKSVEKITPTVPSSKPVEKVAPTVPNNNMINIVNYEQPKLTKITSEADVSDFIGDYRTKVIDTKFNATDRALPTVNGFKARIDKSPKMNTTLSAYDREDINHLVTTSMGSNREALMEIISYNNLPGYQTDELIGALNNTFFKTDKPVIDGNTSRKSLEKMYRDIYDGKTKNVYTQLTEYGGYYDGTFSYANRVLGRDYHYGSKHNTTYQEKFVDRLAKQRRELNSMLDEWSEEALKLQKEGITDVEAYRVLKPSGFDKALEKFESLNYDVSVHDAQLGLMMKERKIPYDSGFLDTTSYDVGKYGNVNLKYGPTIGGDKTVTPSATRTSISDKYFGTNMIDPTYEEVLMRMGESEDISENIIDLVDDYDPLFTERAKKLSADKPSYDGFTFDDFFGKFEDKDVNLTPEEKDYRDFKEFASKNTNFSYALKNGVPIDEIFDAKNQYFYTNNFIDSKYYEMFGDELKNNPDMVKTMVEAYGGNPNNYVTEIPNLELRVMFDDFDRNINESNLLLPAPTVKEPYSKPVSTLTTPDVIYGEYDINSAYNMKMRGIKADKINRMEQDLYEYKTTLLPQLTVNNFHDELDKVGNIGVEKYYERLAARNEMFADVSGLNGFKVSLDKGADVSQLNQPLAEWDLSKNLYLNRDVSVDRSIINDIATDMFSIDSSFDIYKNGELINTNSRFEVDKLVQKFENNYAVKGDMIHNKLTGKTLYKLPGEDMMSLALEDAYSGGVTAKIRENMQILAEADDVFHVEHAYKVIEDFIGEESARTILPKYSELLDDFKVTQNRMIEDFNGVYSQEIRDTAAGILKRYHTGSDANIENEFAALKGGVEHKLGELKTDSLKELNMKDYDNIINKPNKVARREEIAKLYDNLGFYDMVNLYDDGELDEFILDSMLAAHQGSRELDELDDYLITIGETGGNYSRKFLEENFEPTDHTGPTSVVSFVEAYDNNKHKDYIEHATLGEMVDGYLKTLATDEGVAFLERTSGAGTEIYMEEVQKFNNELYRTNMADGSNYFHFMRNDRSINELNKAIYDAVGVEEFFETDLARQFVKHSVKKNKSLYQSDAIDDYIRFFTQNSKSDFIRDSDIPIISSKELVKRIGYGEHASEELIKELGLSDVYSRGYIPPLVHLTEDQALNLSERNIPVHYTPKSSFDVMVKSQLAQYRQDTNAFLNIYDKFLNVYKVNTTAVNPGFHTRNKMGNVWQNYLDIGSEAYSMDNFITARDIIKGKEGMLDGTDYSYEDIRNLIKSHQVLDTGFWDLDSNISLGDVARGGTLNPLDTANFAPYKLGGWIGGNIEGQDRVINYITHLKNGASPASALNSVNKFLFDYSDLTVFESQFMRRVMPFYTWQRKNIPLQLSMIGEKPEIFSRLNHAINAIESLVAEEDKLERGYMASWTDDWIQLPGSFTNEEGRDESIIFNPNLPYGDVGGIVSNKADLFNMLTPAIKLPYELIANRNVFFDSPIVKYEGHTVDMPEVFRRPVGFGSNDEEPTQISPKVRHLLNYFVPVNNLNNIMEAEGKDKTHKIMRTLTGLSASTYDGDKYKRYVIEQRLRELNEDARKRQFGR